MAEHSRCQPGRPRPQGESHAAPARFVLGLGRLPEREVLRVLLGVVVLRDARARLDLARVEARELAVAGKLVDREVDRAVLRLVRHAALDQPLDERDHLRDEVGRLRIVLGVLDAQELAIRVEDLGRSAP